MIKPFSILIGCVFLLPSVWALPGDLVTAFGESGISTFSYNDQDGDCTVVARLPDGCFLTGSTVKTAPSVYKVLISKLLEDGSLDLTFGSNGGVFLSGVAGANPQAVSAVALLLKSDGNIAVAAAMPGGGVSRVLSPAGEEVTAQAINYLSLPSGRLKCAILDSQDRVYLGGVQRSTSASTDDDGWVARFLPSGGIDSSFGSNGKHTYGGAGHQGIHCLALSPKDNVLYVGGFSGNDAVIRRQYPSTGGLYALPNTLIFRNAGVNGAYVACAIHVDSVGRPVVVASTTGQQSHPIVVRFHVGMALDTAFGTSGIMSINSTNEEAYPRLDRVIGTAMLADDGLLVTGLVAASPTSETVGSRLIARTGTAELGFGEAGWAMHAPLRHLDLSPACVVLPVWSGGYLVPGWMEGFGTPGSRQAVVQVEAPPPQSMEALEVTIVSDQLSVPNEASVFYGVNATTSRAEASLTYRWYSNGNLIPGQSASQYAFTLNYGTETNVVSLMVSDGTDSHRRWFTGRVFGPPSINSPPGDQLTRLHLVDKLFAIGINGRNPKTVRCYVDDVLTTTSTINSNVFYFGGGAFNGVGSNSLRITAVNADGDTAWEGMLRTLANPSVLLNQESLLVDVGSAVQMPVQVWSSATSGAFGLEKDGVTVPGGLQASIPAVASVQLHNAGSYRVRFGTTLGIAYSPAFRLCVVADEERQTLAKAGGSIQLNARAAGPGLSYTWFYEGQPLVDSPEVTGSGSATLQLSNLQTVAEGVYACFVNSGAGPSKRAGQFFLRMTDAPPNLDLLQLPPFITGEHYYYQIPPDLLVGEISIKNLPPGITLNSDGNILSGAPTRPGRHQLVITASNPSGIARNVVQSVTVEPVRESLRGLHVCDFSTLGEDGFYMKMELRVSDSGHYSAVLRFSALQGKYRVFRKSGVLLASSAFDDPYADRIFWNLPKGALFRSDRIRIRVFSEFVNEAGTQRMAVGLEQIEPNGAIQFVDERDFTRAWSQLPQTLAGLRGVYNFELSQNQGLTQFTAPTVVQLVFNHNRRVLLRGKLGDRSPLVASPIWTEGNGLYFNNISRGNRSYTHGLMVYAKGTSLNDWDTQIQSVISKPSNLKPPLKPFYPSRFTSVWEGVGTRYLPPNTPFLSGPMPFNSRQQNPLYAWLMGFSDIPWDSPTGLLRPNFTGSGFSSSDLRSVYQDGFFLLPSTLKIHPRTGYVSGKFWTLLVVNQFDDDGEYLRTRRSIAGHTYSGFVTRAADSTISKGSCQSFLPNYTVEDYPDANGNVRQALIKFEASQAINLFVHDH